VEPIHYLRAFRRRWWIIATAVIVAGAAAWITTEVSSPSSSSLIRSGKGSGFEATTVLWNPGVPLVGQGSTFTVDQLAQLVTLPAVSAIAAKDLDFTGDTDQLANQVSSTADATTGFLEVTATADGAKAAQDLSSAFSRALIDYLEKLKNAQVDQQQELLLRQIAALERQGGTDPSVIASIRAALPQLALNRAAPVSLMVIQPPDARKIPSTPATGFEAPKGLWPRVLLACLLGLLAGLALALILERFDTRIRTRAAAEEAFGLPVLAEVPAIPRRRRKGVVTASHPISRAADAFRLLSVGIARSASTEEAGFAPDGTAREASAPRTILITSAEPRDGKTTVAANVAAAYAEVGKRVLVLSCDLRRPGIHRLFGVADSPGLAEMLAAMNGGRGHAERFDLGPYVGIPPIARIAVLPSGATPERPGELLGSATMQSFMEEVRGVSDVIVLDCAPLLVASDVAPLTPHVDAVVLVSRAGKTRSELAARSAGLIQHLGAKVIGVVLNDARELSIPLARRRLYRPSRRARRAAKRARAARPAQEQGNGEWQTESTAEAHQATPGEPTTPVAEGGESSTPTRGRPEADRAMWAGLP
jgi:capsular exopolysaccharide synthesis family protein